MTPLVRLWIWVSAFATLAGWGLSAVGQLNASGYAAAFTVFVLLIAIFRRSLGLATGSTVHSPQSSAGPKAWTANWRLWTGNRRLWTKALRRFRRPLPFCFAALAVLIFLGGTLYPSGNYTGMTYRVPRVLQWLAHGHWLWIHTPDYRMNDRACGIEWLSAPLLLFTHSLRGLFLLNFLPFLLLPGLIFSVCTRLGVRPRVVWPWMWLLPTGYNFILQAGGTANDAFPTVYALAAVDFALRARNSNKFSDAAHSVLAAALMTGAKASNLPLLLPWAIAIVPSAKCQVSRNGNYPSLVTRYSSLLLIAAAVSFLPNAVLNAHFCGDWSGAVLEPPAMTVKNPLIAVSGNAFQLLLDNFTPPLFPWAGWWNDHAPLFMPRALVAISEHFDKGFFTLGELPTEDWAGIGFGLSVLLSVSVAANFFRRNPRPPAVAGRRPSAVLLLAPWISLLVYCAKAGMTAPGRLIAPYYPLLLPWLLAGAAQSQIVRRRWWRALAGGVLVLAFVVLALSPDRPLWPAQTILSGLAARHPGSHLVARAREVYAVYARRADPLADVRALLPPDVQTVGFIAGPDDCSLSLWRPFGSRRVEDFFLTDPPAQIRARVDWAVVSGAGLNSSGLTLDDWLKKSGAELVASTNATLKVSEGPEPWFVVRFKP